MDDYFRAAAGADAPRIPTAADAAAALDRHHRKREPRPRKRFRRRGAGILGLDTDLRHRLAALFWLSADPNVILALAPEDAENYLPPDIDLVPATYRVKEPLFSGGPAPGLPPMPDHSAQRHASPRYALGASRADALAIDSAVLTKLPPKVYDRGPVDDLVLSFLGNLSPTKNAQFLTQVELISEAERPRGTETASAGGVPWLDRFTFPTTQEGGLNFVTNSDGHRIVIASRERMEFPDGDASRTGRTAVLRRKLPPTTSPSKIVRRYARKRTLQFAKVEADPDEEEEEEDDDEDLRFERPSSRRRSDPHHLTLDDDSGTVRPRRNRVGPESPSKRGEPAENVSEARSDPPSRKAKRQTDLAPSPGGPASDDDDEVDRTSKKSKEAATSARGSGRSKARESAKDDVEEESVVDLMLRAAKEIGDNKIKVDAESKGEGRAGRSTRSSKKR